MNGRDVLLDLGSVTGQVSPRSDNMGEISLSQNLIGKLVKCTMHTPKNRQYKAKPSLKIGSENKAFLF